MRIKWNDLNGLLSRYLGQSSSEDIIVVDIAASKESLAFNGNSKSHLSFADYHLGPQ